MREGFLILATPSAGTLIPRAVGLPRLGSKVRQMGVRAMRGLEDRTHLTRDGPHLRRSLDSVEDLHVAQQGGEGALFVPPRKRVLLRWCRSSRRRIA